MTILTTAPVDKALTTAPSETADIVPSWCKNAAVSENADVRKILDGLPIQQLQEKGITIKSGGIASHIFTAEKDNVSVQFQLSAGDPLLIVSIPKDMKLSAVFEKSFKAEDYTPDGENSKKTKPKQRVWPTFRDSKDSMNIKNPNSDDVMGVINAVFALEQK